VKRLKYPPTTGKSKETEINIVIGAGGGCSVPFLPIPSQLHNVNDCMFQDVKSFNLQERSGYISSIFS
jgi:hypothetical protein